MIKIGKHLYVHFTFFMLLAAGYINRNLEIILISYASVFLHECAHLLAALMIGLMPSHITLYPFGVNLKLKNNIVYGLAEEILLYLSGPLANALLALAVSPFIRENPLLKIFYCNNISLFLFNLMPVLPMDGGTVAKKVLAGKIGSRNAGKFMKILSAVLIFALVIFEAFLAVVSGFNFSVVFVAVFLLGNVFTNKEKYNPDLTRELMFYRKKDGRKVKKVKTYLIKDGADLRELAGRFAAGCSYAVFREGCDGRIKEILTEREVIEKLLNVSEKS